jgi:putative flippase GtrA
MFRRKKPRIIQFLRFCTVGLGNTGIDFFVFYLFTLVGIPYLLAQVCSYSAGVLNSFFLNRYWTFRVKSKANLPEAAKFMVVNLVSLAVASGLLYALHDLGHLNLWLGKIAATGAGIAVNFLGSRLWVFTDEEKKGGQGHESEKGGDSRRRFGLEISAGYQSAAQGNAAHCRQAGYSIYR